MDQKTYCIENDKEFKAAITEIKAGNLISDPEKCLLQYFPEKWDLKSIQDDLSYISSELPGVRISGMTNYSSTAMTPEHVPTSILTLLRFDSSDFKIEIYNIESLKARDFGRLLVRDAAGIPDVKALLLGVADFEYDVSELLESCSESGIGCPIVGCKVAIDDWVASVSKAYVFIGTSVYAGSYAYAAFFSGKDLHVRANYTLGWRPIGKKFTITQVDEKKPYIVKTIDDKPASFFYEKYLGLKENQITALNVCEFPLIFEKEGRLVARNGGYVQEAGGVQMLSAVREGDVGQLSYGDPYALFSDAYQESLKMEKFQPQALFAVVCISRCLFLGDEEHYEIDFLKELCSGIVVLHGCNELFLDEASGLELNSAFVTFGMREGGRSESYPSDKSYSADIRNSFNRIIKEYDSLYTVPILNRMGAFMTAITQDLEEMAQKANAANEAKTKFLTNISHEIRTPINSVLGFNEMIMRRSNEVGIRDLASNIQQSGRTLLTLINDVIDLSKMESGKLEIVPAEYNLSTVLMDLSNLIRSRVEEKGLEFNLDVDVNIPNLLKGDETRIKQCVINILTNAVKYTERGAVTMRVSSRRKDAGSIYLGFRIKDTGIGIRNEDLERLFVPFERIEEERNSTKEGTGIGMNIVNKILKLMGSRLEVASIYGEGSDFSFEVEQEVIKWDIIGNYKEKYRQDHTGETGYREGFQAPDADILVVDDTKMNLAVFEGLLKETRMNIDPVESGAEALELVTEKCYDIIFLDQRMPNMDGTETLHRMKLMDDNMSAASPVIMLTANVIPGAREEYISEGFDDYIPKPIDVDMLEEMLISYLPPEKILRYGDPGFSVESMNPLTSGGGAVSGAVSADQVPPAAAALEVMKYIPGVNFEAAVQNCMNEEILLDAVRMFVESEPSNLADIKEFSDSGDYKNITIRVHALKSSARMLGAADISDDAAWLEECGDKGMYGEIDEGLPDLLRRYHDLAVRLSVVAAVYRQDSGTGGAEGAQPISEDEIREAYMSLRELIEGFDYDSAGDLVEMLSEYAIPVGERERFSEIKQLLTAMDRESLLKVL